MTEQEWLASTEPAAMLRSLELPDELPQGRSRMPSDRKLRLFACACCRLLVPDPRAFFDIRPRHLEYLADAEAWADGAPRPHWRSGWLMHDRALDAARGAVGDAKTKATYLRDICGNPFRPLPTLRYECSRCKGDPQFIASETCQDCRGRCWVPAMDWLTPTVIALAQAAYDERPECDKCEDGWINTRIRNYESDDYSISGKRCDSCHGTGRLQDGTLDPERLLVLSDALESAGCDNAEILSHLRSPCEFCSGSGWAYEVDAIIPGQPMVNPRRAKCMCCNGTGRDLDDVHVRGCWVVDSIVGKG